MFDNDYNVTMIEITERVRCYCPLGNDYYTADVVLICKNPKTIPDYLDIDAYARKLDGKEMIIEKLVAKMFKMFKKETSSKNGVIVKAIVADASHAPVIITKSS